MAILGRQGEGVRRYISKIEPNFNYGFIHHLIIVWFLVGVEDYNENEALSHQTKTIIANIWTT
jgi:hypothetical protein